jgi:CheY-like chemotaxis protein
MEKLSHEQFLAYVRSDLNHLYDPDRLRRSPLAELFRLSERLDAPTALQKILVEAIEQLKPGDAEPPQSRMWRIYDILLLRYVHGYERDQVAGQLGLSGRQFSREQLTALETLALQLWEKYAVEKQPAPASPEAGSPSPEAAWLKDLPPEKYSSLKAILTSVVELTRPLARQWQVELSLDEDDLPGALIPQYALRHALLNMLGAGIPWAGGGRVELSVLARAGEADVSMRCSRPPAAQLPAALGEAEQANLEIARQLAHRNSGSLELTITPGSLGVTPGSLGGTPAALSAVLTLPVMEQQLVLVIDDNADMLHLYERYVQGTRYTLAGSQDPSEALALAEKLAPRVIILDVMMPEIDGWDILMRLREQVETSGIPVIICTILPQEGLAYSLGANAFLQKPVLPEVFLRTLERLCSAPPPAAE